MAVKQDGTRRCKDCGQIAKYMHTTAQCVNCYKRLVWRPSNSAAVERSRATTRARKERYRGACEDCGAPTAWCSGGGGKPARWCAACFRKNHLSDLVMAGVERKWGDRRQRIVELWNDGATLREIAAELETTVSALGSTMVKLRGQGYDLPYRYRTYAQKPLATTSSEAA